MGGRTSMSSKNRHIVLIVVQEWTVIKMIEKLKQKLKTHLGNGIFHDSRADANTIAEYCNVLTKKINELVDAVNELQSEQSKF